MGDADVGVLRAWSFGWAKSQVELLDEFSNIQQGFSYSNMRMRQFEENEDLNRILLHYPFPNPDLHFPTFVLSVDERRQY